MTDPKNSTGKKRLRQASLFTFIKKRKTIDTETDELSQPVETGTGSVLSSDLLQRPGNTKSSEPGKKSGTTPDQASIEEVVLSERGEPSKQSGMTELGQTAIDLSTRKPGPSHAKELDQGPSLEESLESPTVEFSTSQPLFSESDSQEFSDSPTLQYSLIETADHTANPRGRGVRFGTPLEQLQRAPDCSCALPSLQAVRDFTILFRTEFTEGEVPRPFPDQYQDRWDATHVRMPCSKENLYPVKDTNGKSEVKSRWELIQASLLNNISSSVDLEESILAYNTRYNKRWNFQALHSYFLSVLDREASANFFKTVLPGMVRLALELPKICTKPIPLLRKQMNHTVFLSQHQVASLLANAFFCTFPRRNAQREKSEYSNYPSINFNRLFEGQSPRKKEKLRCIVNYFRRVTSKTPSGTVSFTRRALRPVQLPDWSTSQAKLGTLHVSSKGNIETDGKGMLQMDFANSYIGGGVLNQGCVQEEIRFLICPELIVSRLFTEQLAKNECLVMKGAEQYSSYSGYADSFKWTGNYDDMTSRDEWRRRETEIVAIDAIPPWLAKKQYQQPQLERELNKAYCGFYGNRLPKGQLPAVATGNWGCGAFGGDPRLKALLQLMAAAEAQREVVYFTFHDGDLCRDIHNMHQFLQSQDVSVGELLKVLSRYGHVTKSQQKTFHPELYPFIFKVFTDFDSDTDDDAAPPDKQDTQGTESPDYKVDTP